MGPRAFKKPFWSKGGRYVKECVSKIVALVCLLLCVVSPAHAENELEVYVDESINLSLGFQFSEYALGNDAIAGCVVRRNDPDLSEFVINGVAKGTTNLIFWDNMGVMREEYEIIVKERDLGQMLDEVKSLLASIGGISAAIVGEKVVVKGEARTTQDMKLVTTLLEDRSYVINTVTLSPTALKVLSQIINEFVGGEGTIKVKPMDQSLVLYGTSYGEGSAQRVEDFAKIFHLSVVNLIKEKKVGLDPGAGEMIQVHAHFMEVNKKAVEALGVNWAPGSFSEAAASKGETIQDGERSSSSVWQLTGFLTNLLPKFNNARERNMGRQLQVSSVSVKSGESAEFQSGGELGYPVVSAVGATSLAFKNYGVLLEVLPIAQGDKITLKVKVKINMPSDLGAGLAGAAASYINFTNSEVETVQYCSSGDSIAISGLLGQVDSKTFDANPGNSNALFELFRSRDYQMQKSELVIFITPEILGQAKDANMDVRQVVHESFDSYDPVSR